MLPRRIGWGDRAKDLLPVEYCHVVFTVPEDVAAIALQNKRGVYGIPGAGSQRPIGVALPT